jgi:hypothetical protein
MRNKYKKIGLVLVVTILLGTVLSFGVNFWINAKLPKIISENNGTPYIIKYDNLEVSLLTRKIEATGIRVVPKERERDSLRKNGVFASVQKILISDYSILPLLFQNKIEAHNITFIKPKITLFKDNDKSINSSKGISSRIVAPFQQLIKVANLDLEQGAFYVINLSNNKTLFQAKNVKIQINEIAISKITLNKKIPFNFKSYAFSCDSLLYLTNSKYKIEAQQIVTTNVGLEVKKFSMLSELNRKQFVNHLPLEKDLYNLKSDKISIKNMSWGFKEEILFFSTNHIAIDRADANIYRSKVPADDRSVKPLYNKLLRELKFDMKIDTLSISNTKLVYEEEKNFDKGAGTLTFNDFNLRATHINSGFKKTNLPEVTILVKCKFMNQSPMSIDWRFNVMSTADRFSIKGSIHNLKTKDLAVFTKPYLNATFTGDFDQIFFNFNGDNTRANGDFASRYSNLKLSLFQKKDPTKKSKLKSWIGNLLMDKDSNEELVENKIVVERDHEKSFFNYLWLCIADGLKKTLV